MAYVKPTKEQIKFAMDNGWEKEDAERGYTIFNFDALGLLNIEAIGDVYVRFDNDGGVYQLGPDDGYDDEACAREAERSGFCKIIPISELPDNFAIDGIGRRWFGWVDTPENRKAIQDYCDKNNNFKEAASMTDQQIKVMFSKEILNIGDKSVERCLRKILFSEGNKINWQEAYEVALYYMPELKNYKPE